VHLHISTNRLNGVQWHVPHEPAPFRTKDEAALLRVLIRKRGQDFVDEWADTLLAHARAHGDLDPKPRETLH
jgi:hypothetical protein